MRTLTVALVAGMLAGCGSIGEIDDDGRTYQQAIDAPVDANLEPLAGEPSIRILRDPLPTRGGGAAADEGESSACEAERWQQLIGMTVADAQAQDLPSSTRTVEWGGMVTQDYVPSRMNVHLDQNGRVYRVICG